MELFIVILNKTDYLDGILKYFVEAGVTGATILDAMGMGHILSSTVPVFAGLKDLLSGGRPYGKLIFSIVNAGMSDKLAEGITTICGGIDQPQSAIMTSIPINKVWGLNKKK